MSKEANVKENLFLPRIDGDPLCARMRRTTLVAGVRYTQKVKLFNPFACAASHSLAHGRNSRIAREIQNCNAKGCSSTAARLPV